MQSSEVSRQQDQQQQDRSVYVLEQSDHIMSSDVRCEVNETSAVGVVPVYVDGAASVSRSLERLAMIKPGDRVYESRSGEIYCAPKGAGLYHLAFGEGRHTTMRRVFDILNGAKKYKSEMSPSLLISASQGVRLLEESFAQGSDVGIVLGKICVAERELVELALHVEQLIETSKKKNTEQFDGHVDEIVVPSQVGTCQQKPDTETAEQHVDNTEAEHVRSSRSEQTSEETAEHNTEEGTTQDTVVDNSEVLTHIHTQIRYDCNENASVSHASDLVCPHVETDCSDDPSLVHPCAVASTMEGDVLIASAHGRIQDSSYICDVPTAFKSSSANAAPFYKPVVIQCEDMPIIQEDSDTSESDNQNTSTTGQYWKRTRRGGRKKRRHHSGICSGV